MDTMTSQDRAAQAWRLLDAEGARHTMARGLVIDALAAADGHLSVSAIHQRVAATRPELNVSTVHRTVNFLVGRGIAHVLPWPGEALIGLNESPHVHAICEGCGNHVELPAGDLGKAVAEARRHSGLELGATGVALIGRCRSCVAA